jgi:hypothetical protein
MPHTGKSKEIFFKAEADCLTDFNKGKNFYNNNKFALMTF